MSVNFAEFCRKAQRAAETELAAQGFSRTAEGHWEGIVLSSAGQSARIRLVVPDTFPYEIPRTRVLRNGHEFYLPHIDSDGDICLPSKERVLVDVQRPTAIIRDILILSRSVLFPVDEAATTREIREEFLSYWAAMSGYEAYWIIDANAQPSGPIATFRVGKLKTRLLAGTREEGECWAKNVGLTYDIDSDAFHLRLDTLMVPPTITDDLRLGDLISQLSTYSQHDEVQALVEWLKIQSLPAQIYLNAPHPTSDSRVVFAVQVPRPSTTDVESAKKGFRDEKHSIVLKLLWNKIQRNPVLRFAPRRLDSRFLLMRTGANLSLLNRHVVVLGCGSVGSFVAENLALSGTGRITLVDSGKLLPENVQRHLLGIDTACQTGFPNKASALAQNLSNRFPHLRVDGFKADVHAFLARHLDVVRSSDLVLVCVGDQTLELSINAQLQRLVPRIHIWLEPVGIGGHVLNLTRSLDSGCYECLFQTDDTNTLWNIASLVGPNQNFNRTIGGCGGSFTPNGALDVAAAALEGARVAINVLQNPNSPASLTTWILSQSEVLDEGYQLSPRGASMIVPSKITHQHLVNPLCPICNTTV